MTDRRTFLAGILTGAAAGALPAGAVPLLPGTTSPGVDGSVPSSYAGGEIPGTFPSPSPLTPLPPDHGRTQTLAQSDPNSPPRAPQATHVTRSLLLLQCHIAGTSYAGIPDRMVGLLVPGIRLGCRREPENHVDPLAIRIELGGRKLGYVPRANNEVIARLMDGGARIEARVTGSETVRSWLKVDVELWLHGFG